MPWREIIFTADGGVVLPPSWTAWPHAKIVKELEIDERLALERLGSGEVVERLGSDAISMAATPSQSPRGSKIRGGTKERAAPESPAARSSLLRADECAELPFSKAVRAIEDRFAKRASGSP
ncbi:hypothetical protein T484DRAFT_1751905 [Baffinella frigidus]|nr:hypothetical protein T484DRAFT_1751905 [Cryptophyta sp. CCMP2293]